MPTHLTSESALVGLELGHYRISEKIGAGGMGEVYRALDEHLDREVAIKVLPPGTLADEHSRKQFHKEAIALSRLNHPNIATIHDFDTQQGVDFLVMEYIPGISLSEKLASGPLPEKEVLRLGVQLAEGLSAAHEHGVVHRDLKPGNLRVTGDGWLKILDFGLAKLRHPVAESGATESLTETRSTVGTVPYMAPEQLLGGEINAGTDIHAAGAVLYEMAAGRRPFAEVERLQLIGAILQKSPPPPSAVNPKLSTELDRIIGKCLEKEPENRYQSAKELAVDLRRLQTSERSVVQPAASDARGRRAKLLGLGLGLLASVIVLLMAFLLAVNVGGVRDRLLARKPATTLDPKRVAVAIFENRTADASLDPLGKMAAESISEGLLQIGTIQVVPSSAIFELAASGASASRTRDPVRALSEATGSGLVVSGAYYLQGQTLQVRASIMDLVANKPVHAVEPANGPREKAMEAVESVRQRLIDAVAARYLNPSFDLLVEEVKPPRYEAQKEMAAGWELIDSDLSAASVHFKRALEIDPEFVFPSLLLASAINSQGKFAEAAAQLDIIEKKHTPLTPTMRLRVNWLRADIFGRLEELYSVSHSLMKLVPDSVEDALDLALAAGWTNRPREAVEVFKTHQQASIFQPSKPNGVFLLLQWTGALHHLGEHEEELNRARWGRGIYPHLLNLHAFEARALVELGRIDEMEKLVDEIVTVPSKWAYPSCCLPRATPGYVMLSAAEELRAHGHREASLKMASRAVDWYRSRVGEEARKEDMRTGLGDALYRAERWEEANAVFASLAAEHPDNVVYKGLLGTLAARRGDRAKAQRIAEELRRIENPYLTGDQTFRSARIIAVLGDKERAVALLREAIAQGGGFGDEAEQYNFGFTYGHSMDLEALRGYPPFEELIRPKG